LELIEIITLAIGTTVFILFLESLVGLGILIPDKKAPQEPVVDRINDAPSKDFAISIENSPHKTKPTMSTTLAKVRLPFLKCRTGRRKFKTELVAWLWGKEKEKDPTFGRTVKKINFFSIFVSDAPMSDGPVTALARTIDTTSTRFSHLNLEETTAAFDWDQIHTLDQKETFQTLFPFLRRPKGFLELELLFSVNSPASKDEGRFAKQIVTPYFTTTDLYRKKIVDKKGIQRFVDAPDIYKLFTIEQLLILVSDELALDERREKALKELSTREEFKSPDTTESPHMKELLSVTLRHHFPAFVRTLIRNSKTAEYLTLQEWLIRLLKSPEKEVVQFAAENLGHFGNREAAIALYEIKDKHFRLSKGDEVIEEALAKVQARLDNAQAGHLAISSQEDEKEGQLSLNAARQGAVSIKAKS